MSPKTQLQEFDPQVPYSQESEKAVCGAILTNGQKFHEIARDLKAEDFFLLRHQWIWAAMERIAERDEQIDYLVVAQELRDMGRFDEIGGFAYLLELVNGTPSSVHADTYAKLVERASVRRRLLRAAEEIRALALDEERPVEDVTVEAQRSIMAVQVNNRHALVSGPASLDRHADELDRRRAVAAQGGRVIYPLPARWGAVNEYVPGIPVGKLAVISGGSGAGKSAALEDWAEFLAQFGGVEYFHTEMSTDDMLDRRLARWSGMSYDRILQPHRWSETEKKAVALAQEKIARFADRINYHWVPDIALDTLRSEMVAAAQRGVKFFVLDHINDVRVIVPRGQNEIRAYEQVPIFLSAFAEKRQAILLVGSQENDKGQTKWGRKIEEKATLRISIKREKLKAPMFYGVNGETFQLNEGDQSATAKWIIRKGRFSRGGEVKMLHHGPGFTWMDVIFSHTGMGEEDEGAWAGPPPEDALTAFS